MKYLKLFENVNKLIFKFGDLEEYFKKHNIDIGNAKYILNKLLLNKEVKYSSKRNETEIRAKLTNIDVENVRFNVPWIAYEYTFYFISGMPYAVESKSIITVDYPDDPELVKIFKEIKSNKIGSRFDL